MLTYSEDPAARVAEIDVDGGVTRVAFDDLAPRFGAFVRPVPRLWPVGRRGPSP